MSKFIPFRFLPASWGLNGKSFDEAEARYSLTGLELELRLAEINYEGSDLERAVSKIHKDYDIISEYQWELQMAALDLEGNELIKMLADINKKHGMLDEYEWMRTHILADFTGVDQDVELVKLDMEFAKIEKRAGEKKIAALLKEPWVSIVEEGLDIKQGPSGFYFVFDWNEQWIDLLRKHGYEGESEDELMERWFTDVCRNEVMESAPIPFNSSVVYD